MGQSRQSKQRIDHVLDAKSMLHFSNRKSHRTLSALHP